MRPETRFKFNAYLTRVAELNGISTDDVSKKFTVEPSVTQTLMNKVQESSAFLQTINILPVAEMKGEKIGVGVTPARLIPRAMMSVRPQTSPRLNPTSTSATRLTLTST